MKKLVVLMITVIFGSSGYAQGLEGKACTTEPIQELRVPYFDQLAKKNDIYFIQLLQLALEKTETCEKDFRIDYVQRKYSSKRFRAEVYKNRGLIDVYWSMASDQVERELLPIKIPLLKGMNGYRVLVIRKEDQEKFSKIKTLADLSQFSAGQASDWPDVDVLRNNGLKVVTSNDGDLLYRMLASRRFDYLPRGVHEASSELEINGDGNLTVCENLVLSYNAPVYFIVNKNRSAVADRITKGLSIAQADGSFQNLFNNFPNFKNGVIEMQQSKRFHIPFNSPYFGPDN